MFKQFILLIIFAFVLSFQGTAYAHGEYPSKKESKTFHSRIKGEFRHIHFTPDQTAEINNLLGRAVSVDGIKYKKITKDLPSNRNKFLGRLYKLEVGKSSEKIVTLLEIRGKKITGIDVSSDNPSVDASLVAKYLNAHFVNHSLDHISYDIASLKNKGEIGHGCGASLHELQVTQEEFMEQMKTLKKLEEEYSLLSLVQENLAIDIAIH